MKAEVKFHNGTPTLFLDGAPAYANFNLLSPFDGDYRAPSLHVPRKFASFGVHLYSIDALGPEWPGPRPDDPSPYDFSPVGPRLQAVLEQDPDAHFLLRMSFETRGLLNNWWNLRYPDERELLGNVNDGPVELEALRQSREPSPRRPAQSFASTLWFTQAQALLRAYIAHLRTIGLYDRVIAYQIAAGVVGEWIKGDADMSDLCGDYSDPMRHHFRTWLRRKYGNDVSGLRKAWDDPSANFNSAEPPLPKAQLTTRHGLFRDPSREQKVIDFYACYAELCADRLLGLCQTAKAATQGEKLTGAFYGYLMELSWNLDFFGYAGGGDYSTIQRSGHLGLSRVLRSPHIDFLVSPYCYPFRGVGGDGLAMQPTESCRQHGKIYLFEEDTLMHNRFEPDGRMQPVEHTMAIYQRNFAQCLTHGHGITWLQSSAYPEYSEIEAEADALQRQMQTLGTWALQLDRTPQAEIAVLLDEDSYFYTSVRNDHSLPGVFYQRVINLPRIGAPHDLYLLRDLAEGKLPPYKLYIFLNAFRLTRSQRSAIAKQVKCEGRTALWLYAPGYLYDDASSPAIPPPKEQPVAPLHVANMTDLTGIGFSKWETPWSLQMHITNFQHPITQAIPQDLFWGTQRMLGPIFHVDDPAATILGQVIYSLGRCVPGLALKELGEWRSIYCSTPNLPPPLLRGIAQYAGVHLYSTAGDVLYATPDLLSVHTTGGGPRTFQLPRRVEVVYDLLAMRPVAHDVTAFNVTLAPASTVLYYTGSQQQIEKLLSANLSGLNQG